MDHKMKKKWNMFYLTRFWFITFFWTTFHTVCSSLISTERVASMILISGALLPNEFDIEMTERLRMFIRMRMKDIEKRQKKGIPRVSKSKLLILLLLFWWCLVLLISIWIRCRMLVMLTRFCSIVFSSLHVTVVEWSHLETGLLTQEDFWADPLRIWCRLSGTTRPLVVIGIETHWLFISRSKVKHQKEYAERNLELKPNRSKVECTYYYDS